MVRPAPQNPAGGPGDGQNLAALPTLTVQLDPAAGVWHLFSGSRLLADNLPLIAAKSNDRQFTVTAGSEAS